MRKRSRLAGLALFAALAPATEQVGTATTPAVEISVERVQNQNEFSFSYASRQEDVFISAVIVSSMRDGKRSDAVCEVYGRPPVNPIRNRWIYGTAPERFEKRGCAPLQPGTYHIEVIGAGSGTMVFRVDETGAAKAVRPAGRAR